MNQYVLHTMKKYTIGLLLIATVLFSACRLDDVPQPGETKERTLLIYMAAQNSLGFNGSLFDYQNIESLLDGVQEHHLRANNIVIFHDPYMAAGGRPDTRPRLLQVIMGTDGEPTTREIEIFDESPSSVSIEGMSGVIDRVLNNPAFAAEKYSFLMWSHGTAWLPPNPNYGVRAIGQDIGQDGEQWMDIDDFAEAIPDGVFDYIAVDACYMAAAEFAWVLRGKADYLIAAPTEIMGTGMPYHEIPDYLLGAQPDYEGFCDVFYEFYKLGHGFYGSTLSLIDLNAMGPVADAVRQVLADATMEQIYAIPTEEMQFFDRNRTQIGTPNTLHPYHIFFDLGSFMKHLATPSELAAFEQAMAAAIPYERHSDSFLLVPGGYGFEINEYSGLSVYVPRNIPELAQVNAYYKTLGWYEEVYP